MKIVLIAISLAGTALAKHPALLRRQDVDSVDISEECRDAASAFVSAFPTEPPSLIEFSSSYYDTTSRTASGSNEECAWITDVPEALYTEVIDYNLEVFEWLQDDDNVSLLEDVVEECPERESATTECQGEWDALETKIIDETGFEPPEPETGDDEDENDDDGVDADEDADDEAGDDPESAAALGFAPQTLTVAALLATFVVGVVLA